MKRKKSKQMLVRTGCYFDNYVLEYLSNILSNHTSQTYVNNQSICCIKLLFQGALTKIWKFHYMLYIKTIPWKFCNLKPKNSRVIYPWSLNFSWKVGYFLTYSIVSVCL